MTCSHLKPNLIVHLTFQVFIELKGSKGIIGKTRLYHKPEGIKSNSYLYEPPFSFKPGSEETFTVRGPDIGDLKFLNVEVKLSCSNCS